MKTSLFSSTVTSRGHVRVGAQAGLIILMSITFMASTPALAQVVMGPELPLSTATVTALGLGGVTMARAANGISLAVWSDDRTGDHDVYGALLSAAGTPPGIPGGFKIAGSPGTDEGDPRIAACHDAVLGDIFLVVWGNGFNDDTTTDVMGTRVNTSGIILDATPIMIASQPGILEHNVRRLASDGVGTFLVPFRTSFGINTQRVSTAGMPLDGPGGAVLARDVDGIGLKKNPSASFGSGLFFVTWDDSRGCPHYPLYFESGCFDIYGAFVDPSGAEVGPQFPTTHAYSCQEGSASIFDGANFVVVHNDERVTNCVTSDVTGERVTPGGVVLDPIDLVVDPMGMTGGISIAKDPPGFPGTRQGGTGLAVGCSILVTYYDEGIAAPDFSFRMKRLNSLGQLGDGLTDVDFGVLISQGLPSPGVFQRVTPVVLGPNTYLLAYPMNNVPTVRTATFVSCGAFELGGDSHINGIDLAVLLGQWTGLATYLPCPPHAPADFNGDCKINGFDLALLLGAWG